MSAATRTDEPRAASDQALPRPGEVVFSHLHGRRVRLVEWLPDGRAVVADLRKGLALSLPVHASELAAR
jgi:hypothetical protein